VASTGIIPGTLDGKMDGLDHCHPNIQMVQPAI
jgi:hypothetical protein